MLEANLFLTVIVITVLTENVRSNDFVRMCYFNAQARYRNNIAKFDTYNIDFSLCTHYIYAYAKIFTYRDTILPVDSPVESQPTGAYKNFTGRQRHSRRDVTLLISIGGQNVTEQDALVELMRSETKARTFAKNVVNFLWYYFFDGLDIDYQYPAKNIMRWDFVKLLEIMRETFDTNRFGLKYLITVRCSGLFSWNVYDPYSISRFADYVVLAAYEFRTVNQTCFGSPLVDKNYISVYSLVNTWLVAGLAPEKTVVGISPVCRFPPGSSFRDDTLPNYYNISNGLAYSEICRIIDNSTWHWNYPTESYYMMYNNKMIFFDEDKSIFAKIDWIKANELAGVMFPALDMDDFKGTCNREPFPLLKMIKYYAMKERHFTVRSSKLNTAYTQKYSGLFIIILLCYLHI